MTITNRAFIKAYRHDAPQPNPTAPAAWSNLRRHVSAKADSVLASSVEYASFAGERGASALEAFSTTIVQNSATLVPMPSASIDALGDATAHQALAGRQEAQLGVPARRLDRNVISKQPLSVFAPAPPRPKSEAPVVRSRNASAVPRSGIGFQPGTTIASFRWPSVCRVLWRQGAGELDRVTQELFIRDVDSTSLVGVVGLFPGYGCTTTLLSLAGPIAARGGRVIVVDANFRSPGLNSLLDVETDLTWQDVLARGIPVGDAVVRAVDDNLDLLPYMAHPASAATPQETIRLHASITAGVLRNAYDLVLVDLGAFFVPETQAMLLELAGSMRLDSAIAVAGPKGTDHRDLDALGEHLQRHGCKLRGWIENQAA